MGILIQMLFVLTRMMMMDALSFSKNYLLSEKKKKIAKREATQMTYFVFTPHSLQFIQQSHKEGVLPPAWILKFLFPKLSSNKFILITLTSFLCKVTERTALRKKVWISSRVHRLVLLTPSSLSYSTPKSPSQISKRRWDVIEKEKGISQQQKCGCVLDKRSKLLII